MSASMTRAEHKESVSAVKPQALAIGARIAVFASASPAEENRIARGLDHCAPRFSPEATLRVDLKAILLRHRNRASTTSSHCSGCEHRGPFALARWYGSNYLLEALWNQPPSSPKCLVGYSDVLRFRSFVAKTSLGDFYGPMAAAGLGRRANSRTAMTNHRSKLRSLAVVSWNLDLNERRIYARGAAKYCARRLPHLNRTTLGNRGN